MLSRSFNEFSGKVVRSKDLKDRLKGIGIKDIVDVKNIAQQNAARSGHKLQVDVLAQTLTSSVYIAPELLADLEAQVMAADSLVEAYSIFGTKALAAGDEEYILVQPLLELAQWAYDDPAIIEVFAKAAKECPEQRDKLPDLKPAMPVVQDLLSKITAKFGRH